jgi:subtilase family serine protease
MIQKVISWGHNKDIDWVSLIEQEFTHDFNGKDFINKYGFNCPTGVRGRNSDNKLYREKIGWEVSLPLNEGISRTFNWINEQVNKK